jgi:hypothetical protein
MLERAFRTSKTVELERRPIYVQLESSTPSRALVVMLALAPGPLNISEIKQRMVRIGQAR